MVFVFSLLLFLSPSVGAQTPLQEAEAELSIHDRLEDFFKDIKSQRRYHEILLRLYKVNPSDFPFRNFQIFLQQVRSAAMQKEHGKLFAEVVWDNSKPMGEAHEVEAGRKETYFLVSRDRAIELWSDYSQKLLSLVRAQFPNFEPSENPRELLSFLTEIDKTTEAFLESLKSSPKMHQPKLQGQFFQDLKNDARVKAAMMGVFLSLIHKRDLRSQFSTENPQKLIRYLRDVRFLAETDPSLPKSFIQLGEVVAKANSSIQESIFSEPIGDREGRGLVDAGTYRFIPSPRAFHNLLADLGCNACTAPTLENIERLSMDRWIVGALRGSQFYFVEFSPYSGGEVASKGHVIMSSVVVNEAMALNLESGTHVFGHDLVDPKSKRRMQFFDAWAEQYFKATRSQWTVVMGTSDIAHNSGTLVPVRSSLTSRFAVSVASHRNSIRPYDAELAALSNRLRSDHSDFKYMRPNHNHQVPLHEAFGLGGSEIMGLTSVEFNTFDTLEGVKEFYENSSEKARVFSQLIQLDNRGAEIESYLRGLWQGDAELNQIKFKVLQELGFDTQMGILRPTALVLEILSNTDGALVRILTLNKHRGSRGYGISIDRLTPFLRGHPLLLEVLPAVFHSRSPRDGFVTLVELAVEQLRTPDEYVRLVKSYRENMDLNDLWLEEIASEAKIKKMLNSQLDWFFSQNPSAEALAELIRVTEDPLLMKKGLHFVGERVSSIADFFLEVGEIHRGVQSKFAILPKDQFRQVMFEFLQSMIPKFLSFEPSEGQILEFARFVQLEKNGASTLSFELRKHVLQARESMYLQGGLSVPRCDGIY